MTQIGSATHSLVPRYLPPCTGGFVRYPLLAAAALACSTLLGACTDRDGGAVGDTAVGASPTTSTLDDIAGTWDMRILSVNADSTLGTFVLTATRDTTGWTMTAPNRQPVPVRVVAVQGDSVVTEAGPFESFLRAGLQVRTRGVMRRQGDRLVWRTEARYQTGAGDSVVNVRSEGTRRPR